MENEPIAWMTENGYLITKDENLANIIKEKGEEPIIPLYTHPAKNNGGNPEELNTRQIQDARTSLESTPPFAYAVVSKECPDGMENMSLQFNEPVEAKKIIPLYTHPTKTLTDEEIIEIWSGMETDTGEQNIAFARAILRKAQEKCTK